MSCTVGQDLIRRRTTYNAAISETDQLLFTIIYTNSGCYYQDNGVALACLRHICYCDLNGLATHYVYNTSSLSLPVEFTCTTENNNGDGETSDKLTPIIPCKCLVFK